MDLRGVKFDPTATDGIPPIAPLRPRYLNPQHPRQNLRPYVMQIWSRNPQVSRQRDPRSPPCGTCPTATLCLPLSLSLSISLSLAHTHTRTHTHTYFLSLTHTLSFSHTHSGRSKGYRSRLPCISGEWRFQCKSEDTMQFRFTGVPCRVLSGQIACLLLGQVPEPRNTRITEYQNNGMAE